MSTALMSAAELGTKVEQVLIGGDLNSLGPEERVRYYNAVCESLGLNPLTQPFAYLKLSGKLTLYARKDCTEQLRRKYGISIVKIVPEQVGDIYVVTAYAQDATGRQDSDMGAVSVVNKKGDDLANAMLKAITKAKRRVTLSICGLGMLDESEIDSIQDAETVPAAQPSLPAKAPEQPAKPNGQHKATKPTTTGADLEKRIMAYSAKVCAELGCANKNELYDRVLQLGQHAGLGSLMTEWIVSIDKVAEYTRSVEAALRAEMAPQESEPDDEEGPIE
jgi:uncharacterized protein YnzC (UPF0291/DUF896 family)